MGYCANGSNIKNGKMHPEYQIVATLSLTLLDIAIARQSLNIVNFFMPFFLA